MTCLCQKNIDESCPCDNHEFPSRMLIDAGLSKIPRQTATFAEFRSDLLSAIRSKEWLKTWRAKGIDDAGVMLIEMWAYLCDVLSFYDEVIAHESYVRTARTRKSLRKLTGLLGYTLRPAVASLTKLAGLVEGFEDLMIPEGTAFRSGGFDGEAPQVFETELSSRVHPFNSRWKLIPPFPHELPAGKHDFLYFDARNATINIGDSIIIVINGNVLTKRIVEDVIPYADNYGNTYHQVFFDSPVDINKDSPFSDIKTYRISDFSLATKDTNNAPALILDRLCWDISTGDRLFIEEGLQLVSVDSTEEVLIENDMGVSFRYKDQGEIKNFREKQYSIGVFPKDMEAVLKALLEALSVELSSHDIKQDVQGEIVSELKKRFNKIINSSIISFQQKMHWQPSDMEAVLKALLGALSEELSSHGISLMVQREILSELKDRFKEILNPSTQSSQEATPYHLEFSVPKLVSKIYVDADLSANRIFKVYYNIQHGGRVKFPPPKKQVASGNWNIAEYSASDIDTDLPDQFLFKDQYERALESPGTINRQENLFIIKPDSQTEQELSAPVEAYGNIFKISRGESVYGEILGSGDASVPYQSFKLKKKPLTYLPVPAADNEQGIKSTLKIWINGMLWSEVPHFYSVSKDEEKYTVRQNDEGESIVTFGDGISGSRLPTGTDNVIASYRFGAAAASPPANSITQLAKPIKGITSVFNPLPAFGGKDTEKSENIRSNGPGAALLLNRAVSIKDMEAIVGRFLDVRAVKAEWRWQEDLQRPAVNIWYIGAEGIKDLLGDKLKKHSDPAVPLSVEQAKALDTTLTITIEVDPDYISEDVKKNVEESLMNKKSGLLAPENIGIGVPLYRSQIFERVMSVAGVLNVSAMSWNDKSFSTVAEDPGPGAYFNIEADNLIINPS